MTVCVKSEVILTRVCHCVVPWTVRYQSRREVCKNCRHLLWPFTTFPFTVLPLQGQSLSEVAQEHFFQGLFPKISDCSKLRLKKISLNSQECSEYNFRATLAPFCITMVTGQEKPASGGQETFSVYFLLFPYPKNFSQFFSSHWKKQEQTKK